MVNLFMIGTVGRIFSMLVERTYAEVQTPSNQLYMNYFNLQIIPAKLSRSAKQHPSNSAHLIRRFVRGLSIYIDQSFILTDFRPYFPTRATRGAGACWPTKIYLIERAT
jgi:hypothetical protein